MHREFKYFFPSDFYFETEYSHSKRKKRKFLFEALQSSFVIYHRKQSTKIIQKTNQITTPYHVSTEM